MKFYVVRSTPTLWGHAQRNKCISTDQKVININRLMQRKFFSFKIITTVFVLILLTFLQAPLNLLDSKVLELPSTFGSIFLWYDFNLGPPQSLESIFSRRCPSYSPKKSYLFSRRIQKFFITKCLELKRLMQ